MTKPIIEVSGLCRMFTQGSATVTVLDDVDLDIYAGEMVAIMGSSGSGKSTLMNILGCLDTPTSGTYRFNGRDVGTLDADALAALRREHFGFIFQRYQLLADLNAVENVEVPAVYAGVAGSARRKRAGMLLERLGLGERLGHRPGQLSGGQKQRVSVARALMNGGDLILADEPTGALDSRSGAELMALLKELNAAGHTIIIVTHDPGIAAQAGRVIEIKDGAVVSDTRKTPRALRVPEIARIAGSRSLLAGASRLGEALRMALRAMSTHRLRTFLTMLGIIIGIASVVGVVALGQGSQETVLENIASIGTNTINVFPGEGFGDMRSGRVRTLRASDADALAEEPYADSVTPSISTSDTAVLRNVSASVQVQGVGHGYFQVNGLDLVAGVVFDAESVTDRAQEAVIDENTRDSLFADGTDPIGQVVIIGRVPVRVIGVVEANTGFGPNSNSLNIYVPYTTVMTRVLGQTYLSSITVRVILRAWTRPPISMTAIPWTSRSSTVRCAA
jgi:macrolide transport system ATP-binding/permease protein